MGRFDSHCVCPLISLLLPPKELFSVALGLEVRFYALVLRFGSRLGLRSMHMDVWGEQSPPAQYKLVKTHPCHPLNLFP